MKSNNVKPNNVKPNKLEALGYTYDENTNTYTYKMNIGDEKYAIKRISMMSLGVRIETEFYSEGNKQIQYVTMTADELDAVLEFAESNMLSGLNER